MSYKDMQKKELYAVGVTWGIMIGQGTVKVIQGYIEKGIPSGSPASVVGIPHSSSLSVKVY